MSNRQHNAERLSAYHDGEVTAEERVAAERLLAEWPDAGQTLDEYGQLSQSLKKLHKATRSPDLREQVLDEITPGHSATPTTPVTSHRGRVVSIVAGLAGLAAAVTLLLLLWPDAQGPPAEQGVAMNEHAPALAADAVFREAAAEADIAPSAAAERHPAAGAAMPELAAVVAAADGMSAEVGETRTAASPSEMESNVALSLEELTRERKLPEVGDIVGYLDQNADELTWVAVTVVDVQTAGDQVQLMLTKHGVETPVASAPRPANRQPSDEPCTIIVEAEWEQMEAVIVDLSDAEFVNTVVVDAPIEEGVPEVLQGYAMSRDADRDHLGENEPAQLLKRQLAGRGGAGRPDGMPAAEGTLTETSGAGNAMQLQALVPDRELQRIAARRGVETLPLAGAASAAKTEDRSVLPEGRDSKSTTGIGAPLARRRAKAVFIIKKSVE